MGSNIIVIGTLIFLLLSAALLVLMVYTMVKSAGERVHPEGPIETSVDAIAARITEALRSKLGNSGQISGPIIVNVEIKFPGEETSGDNSDGSSE